MTPEMTSKSGSDVVAATAGEFWGRNAEVWALPRGWNWAVSQHQGPSSSWSQGPGTHQPLPCNPAPQNSPLSCCSLFPRLNNPISFHLPSLVAFPRPLEQLPGKQQLELEGVPTPQPLFHTPFPVSTGNRGSGPRSLPAASPEPRECSPFVLPIPWRGAGTLSQSHPSPGCPFPEQPPRRLHCSSV